MRDTVRFVALLTALLSGLVSAAIPVVTLSEIVDTIRPQNEFLFLEDPTGSLSFAEARQALAEQGTYWNGVRYPQFGPSESVFWARLNMRNSFPKDDTWVIQLDSPGPNYIDLFYQDSNGDWHQSSSGSKRVFSTRDLPFAKINFVFPVLAGQTQAIYFRISHSGLVQLPVTLVPAEKIQSIAARTYFVDAFQFGALVSIAIALMLVWASSRKPAFFWCSVFLGLATLYAISFNGYALQFWWPEYPLWDQNLQPTASGLAAAAGLVFLSCALTLKGKFRPLRLALRITALVIAAWMVLMMVLPVQESVIVKIIHTLATIAVASGVALIAYPAQGRAIRLLIMASVVFMLGVSLRLLGLATNAVPEVLDFHSTTALTLIAVVFMLAGVTDYILNGVHTQRTVQDELLSARNRAEAHLQQAERIKDQFIDNVSHELITPIHGIINLADGLLNKPEKKEGIPQQEAIILIKDNAARLARLTGDILNIAMLESPSYCLKSAEVDLKLLCTRVVGRCRLLVGDKPIHLLEDFPEESLIVNVDEEKLEHVLVNLLTNAISVTAHGYVMVSINVEEQGDKVVVSVKDSGPGVPAGELKHIFRRFYKLENSSMFAGAGLGLAVSQRIMESHDSKIHVESEPGRGSVFYFTLPLRKPVGARLAKSGNEKSSPNEHIALAPAHPVGSAPNVEDALLSYRKNLIKVMQDCLHAWHTATGGTDVDLARESGIWAVSSDGRHERARAMQRYLSLEKLPANPRKIQVLKTVYFVLNRLRQTGDHETLAFLESSLREFQAVMEPTTKKRD